MMSVGQFDIRQDGAAANWSVIVPFVNNFSILRGKSASGVVLKQLNSHSGGVAAVFSPPSRRGCCRLCSNRQLSCLPQTLSCLVSSYILVPHSSPFFEGLKQNCPAPGRITPCCLMIKPSVRSTQSPASHRWF